MKIGILTVPFNNNYGGFLQAFALKTVLVQMGHEVLFINRKRNKPKGLKSAIKCLLIKFRLRKDYHTEKIKELSIHTNEFKEKYLEPITEEYYSTKDLKKCLKLGIDCFIVGSDQVWRYQYAGASITDFYFSFLKKTKIKRLSYAASFGIDELDYPIQLKNECRLLLNDFCAISVREKSATNILKNEFKIHPDKISFVLDPTLLLEPSIYISLFDNNFQKTQQRYLFTYILDNDNDKVEFINEVQAYLKIGKLALRAQTGDITQLTPIAYVEEWLSKIYYADFVITDSFHGAVFSIIFNKPFLIYGNPERGITRFASLLSIFELENRYIDNKKQFSSSILRDGIKWETINKKRKTLQEESISFLYNNLKTYQ